MSTIFSYVKIFEKQEYAEDFLNGNLYMNPIRYFKEYIDENGELRGDDYEGVIAIYQPHILSEIELENFSIPTSDLSAPIVVHRNDILNKNAFCLYSLNNRGYETVSSDTLNDFKKILEIHDSCYGLGSYCVCVLNVTEFQNRIITAIKNLNIDGSMALVDYFNENEVHGELPNDMHGFQKRNKFSPQREYRLLIDLMRSQPKEFTLEIGDISDICTPIMTPEEFNNKLEIKLPNRY